MKQELDRVRNDVDTMQKALGLAPSMGREWIQWMKRDQWFSLWWCLPGFILIADALLPLERAQRHLGLVIDQWAGLLVAAVMLGITMVHVRKIKAKDGRPEGLVREMKRVNGMDTQGFWWGVVLAAQAISFFVWCKHYQIGFEPFWTGLFLFTGCSCLAGAVANRALLGWAIPFLAYGICLPWVHGNAQVNTGLLGMMFIAVAISFSIIQVWQIRQAGRQNESH